MPSVPNTTTVAMATDTLWAGARITGSAARTAAAPQIALPAPISIEVSRSSFSTRVPIQVAAQNTPATTITSITTPARPTPITSWKVTRKPYSTMPARSSMPLA